MSETRNVDSSEKNTEIIIINIVNDIIDKIVYNCAQTSSKKSDEKMNRIIGGFNTRNEIIHKRLCLKKKLDALKHYKHTTLKHSFSELCISNSFPMKSVQNIKKFPVVKLDTIEYGVSKQVSCASTTEDIEKKSLNIPSEPSYINLNQISELLAREQFIEKLKLLNYPYQECNDEDRVVNFIKNYRNNVISTFRWNKEARSLNKSGISTPADQIATIQCNLDCTEAQVLLHLGQNDRKKSFYLLSAMCQMCLICKFECKEVPCFENLKSFYVHFEQNHAPAFKIDTQKNELVCFLKK